jgi:CubicO group peptidase (beta-lactamase class C family)
MKHFPCFWILLLYVVSSTACINGEEKIGSVPEHIELYFPFNKSDYWDTISPDLLGWDESQISPLLTFLENNNTRAFILLKNGRIAVEAYFGNDLLGSPFQASSTWYWASAGKTLTAALLGIAQEENHLKLSDAASTYLGTGCTAMTQDQEQKITIWHQLTMTTGLDDRVSDNHCTDAVCLSFLASPGTRWAYHNAPYTLLDGVIENSTGQDFDDYFNTRLRDPIGMDGFWTYIDYDHVYFSTARSMARFGLLILAEGKWEGTGIISDPEYFRDMINTSQDLNLSYGYLWWLNGKASLMVPGFQAVIPGSLTPNAPADMLAAMGKNGQLINIVPSLELVMIRMGDNPDNSLVPVSFQNDLWEKLNKVIPSQ